MLIVVLGMVAAMGLVLGVGRTGLAAQVQQPVASPGTTPPPIGAERLPEPVDPYAARMKHQEQVAQADDRRKKMVADADKLLQLATDLKADVDKETRNETSVSAYMKADEIEKLAHDVKQRLKN
ncbi:hypothetical protein GOB94_00570 [Granulicella sp. 5B5]|uniref:hypothetical protein n=1 Tax=Granulicella sp. 5B5 TaxID=1617967 RepID=UPI0015F678B1|nr:hypothetical protein [Granulicella sp. 5B5]QMV17372.1 hypothetical protein GOB94_00570 [Granulicella sp. 5B5]